MGRNQVIHKVPNLLEVQFCGRVRVHHGCVVDVVAVFSHHRPDSQFLHVDVGADEGRKLRRQFADESGLDAPVIDEARHFGGACGRQRGDAAVVAEISVDH